MKTRARSTASSERQPLAGARQRDSDNIGLEDNGRNDATDVNISLKGRAKKERRGNVKLPPARARLMTDAVAMNGWGAPPVTLVRSICHGGEHAVGDAAPDSQRFGQEPLACALSEDVPLGAVLIGKGKADVEGRRAQLRSQRAPEEEGLLEEVRHGVVARGAAEGLIECVRDGESVGRGVVAQADDSLHITTAELQIGENEECVAEQGHLRHILLVHGDELVLVHVLVDAAHAHVRRSQHAPDAHSEGTRRGRVLVVVLIGRGGDADGALEEVHGLGLVIILQAIVAPNLRRVGGAEAQVRLECGPPRVKRAQFVFVVDSAINQLLELLDVELEAAKHVLFEAGAAVVPVRDHDGAEEDACQGSPGGEHTSVEIGHLAHRDIVAQTISERLAVVKHAQLDVGAARDDDGEGEIVAPQECGSVAKEVRNLVSECEVLRGDGP
jgi:hypothetical protein